MKSLQERYAPHNRCFGCGHENDKGLQLKSFPQGEEVIANWMAQPHHEAFPGVLNGGIIGALLDCHSNWTAAYFLMKQGHEDIPPCTVTAYFNVTLKRPTPSDKPVELKAWIKQLQADRAIISAELYSEGKCCATCEGMFVAVKPGHPAYQRW
jgi:hypothetical protein